MRMRSSVLVERLPGEMRELCALHAKQSARSEPSCDGKNMRMHGSTWMHGMHACEIARRALHTTHADLLDCSVGLGLCISKTRSAR